LGGKSVPERRPTHTAIRDGSARQFFEGFDGAAVFLPESLIGSVSPGAVEMSRIAETVELAREDIELGQSLLRDGKPILLPTQGEAGTDFNRHLRSV
jgi:hypothetical protein